MAHNPHAREKKQFGYSGANQTQGVNSVHHNEVI